MTYLKFLRVMAVVSAMALFAGCSNIHLVGSPVAVTPIIDMEKGQKVVALLNHSEFNPQLTAALEYQGFVVVPAGYYPQSNKPTSQWGLRFEHVATDFHCVFTDAQEYNFTLTLVDRTTNQAILKLEQLATSGPCTSVSPVYGSITKALLASWPTSSEFDHPCHDNRHQYHDHPNMYRREYLLKNQQRLAMHCIDDYPAPFESTPQNDLCGCSS